MKLTRILALTLAAGAVGGVHAPRCFRIGMGGTGGTHYPVGGAIANAVSDTMREHPGLAVERP